MIPLKIVLGPKAVHSIIDNYENRKKLEQHCLVYSEELLAGYTNIDEDAAEALMEYIDAHEGEAGFSREVRDLKTQESMEQFFSRVCPHENKNFPSGIVILYEDETGRESQSVENRKTNIITTKEIKENRRNIFDMLSPDTKSFSVEVDEDCRFWAEYFGRIMEGEETVVFMDRYALKRSAIRSLTEYYLPKVTDKTRVIIYASDSEANMTKEQAINEVKALEKDTGVKIELFLLKDARTCHDRWIQAGQFNITQGKGIDMLAVNRDKRTNALSTVRVEIWDRPLPKAERVY